MNSYFPRPSYSEEDQSKSRRGDFNQHRITRKPVLPARPKTAGSRDQHGSVKAADRWAGAGGMDSIAGLDLDLSQWDPMRQNPTVDTYGRPRTAAARAGSKDQYRPSKPAEQWVGNTGVESMAGLDLNRSQRESHPGPAVHTHARPRTAGSKAHDGLSKTTEQWAGNAAVESMAGLNLDHSRWESSRPNLTVETTHVRPRTAESRPRMPGAMTRSYTSSSASSMSSFPPSSTSSEGSPIPSPKSSNVQKAFQEARHFAGSLISHPYVTTRHYSILRHSHGLVFYQGPSTTLTVSIFADVPLSAESTLWLQNKGWSGKTGMRIKALFGADGGWLNVTPTMTVGSEQLKPADERAWQRDIARFRKKAVGHKRDCHKLRSTAIVRIPAEAEDGYFQLILCLGEKKKILCTSPSFRVLSASASPHSVRGASLLTMPLELGAMAVGVYAKATAGRVVGPVVSVATSRIQKFMPSVVTQNIASTAFEQLQVTEKVTTAVGDMRSRSIQARNDSYSTAGAASMEIDSAGIRLEHGPQAPFPICFITPSELARPEHTDLPCLRLRQVSEVITRKLCGYYFGWARFVSGDKKSKGVGDWNQAIISVLSMDSCQLVRASITEANKRITTVQFTEDSEGVLPTRVSLEIKVMGFIRPDDPTQRANLAGGLQASDEAAVQAAIAVYMNDVSAAQSSLDHSSWGPDYLAVQGKPERPGGLARIKSSFADVASKVQLDKMGIRSPVDRMREKTIVANGFWVPR